MIQQFKRQVLLLPTATLFLSIFISGVETATAEPTSIKSSQQVKIASKQMKDAQVEQAIAQYQQLYTQAQQLKEKGTLESKKQAIAKYQQALKISQQQDVRKLYPKEARYLEAGTLVHEGRSKKEEGRRRKSFYDKLFTDK